MGTGSVSIPPLTFQFHDNHWIIPAGDGSRRLGGGTSLLRRRSHTVHMIPWWIAYVFPLGTLAAGIAVIVVGALTDGVPWYGE